ncbi:hypothetical protein NL676_032752 [Syzygium grande]|nr:hypothetical protein NL676_032752 [Syzygium grande]
MGRDRGGPCRVDLDESPSGPPDPDLPVFKGQSSDSNTDTPTLSAVSEWLAEKRLAARHVSEQGARRFDFHVLALSYSAAVESKRWPPGTGGSKGWFRIADGHSCLLLASSIQRKPSCELPYFSLRHQAELRW